LGALGAAAALNACGSEAPAVGSPYPPSGTDVPSAESRPVTAPHLGPIRTIDSDAPQALLASSENLLSNPNGNIVLANVKIVPVFWGSSVNSTVTSTMGGFYSAIVNSGYIDWLNEYSTSSQVLGRGTATAPYTITPANTNTSLSADNVATELASQATAGHLPVPDANTLYMVHFPPGDVIDGTCSDNCGFHGALTKTVSGVSKVITYGIIPDFTNSGCSCDGSGTMIQDIESVSSHEAFEAITDPQGSSWRGPQNEISDICGWWEGPLVYQGTTYTVQRQYSNENAVCLLDGAPRYITAISRSSTTIDVFFRASDVNFHTFGFNGSTWGTDTSLGGAVDSVPAAVPRGSNRIDVFVRGSDGTLYTKSWNGTSWSSFSQLGTSVFTDNPTVVARDSTHLDVFVRGTDGALYTKSWDGTSWSGYTQLGTQGIIGSPAVVARDSTHLDVFVRGTDWKLYTKSWNGTSWSGYTQLGSVTFLGAPSVVSWGASRIDVFVRATDGTLYTNSWDGSTWAGFSQLGTSQLAGSPTAVSWGANRIDVFARGTDSTVYTKSWNGSTWSGYSQLSSSMIAGDVAAVSKASNRIDLFVRGTTSLGTDDKIYKNSWDGSSWSGFGLLGGTVY
jgi:hypothetical protein